MNPKEKKQIIVTMGLVVILAAVVMNTLNQVRPKKEIREEEVAVILEPSQAMNLISVRLAYDRAEEEVKNMVIERDPFSPPVRPVRDSFILSGILWDERNPTAVINNEIVQIGQKINGKTIVDIQKSKVIVNEGKENIEIKLYEE